MPDLDAMKASLEAARVAYVNATAQMNGAKSQYEVAKTRLGTESDKQSLRIAELEKQLIQCGKEKKALEDGKKKILDQHDKEKQKASEDGKKSETKAGPDQRVRNPKVFFDIGNNVGRIVVELFKDTMPQEAEHVRAYCTGVGHFAANGRPLHYKGTQFFFLPSGVFCCTNLAPTLGATAKKNHLAAGDVCVFNYEECGKLFGTELAFTMTNPNNKVVTGVVVGRVVEGLNRLTESWKAGLRETMITDCGELPP